MIRLTPTFGDVVQALADSAVHGRTGAVVPVFHELDPAVVARLGIDPARAYELTVDGPYAGILSTDAMSIVVPSPSVVYVGDQALDHVETFVAPRVADIGQLDVAFVGGAIGMLAHEFMTTLEPTVPIAPGGVEVPTAVFMRVEECVVFDHERERVFLVTTVRQDEQSLERAYERAQVRLDALHRSLLRGGVDREAFARAADPVDPEVVVSVGDDEYEEMVERALEHIGAGDVIQVVLARSFEQAFSADPLDLFRELTERSPAQYHTLLRLDGMHIVGASPEQLVGVRNGRVATNPIAGTRPRGATSDADVALARELRDCPKERAEHMMLVDLGRNDVSRVCRPGTVEVTTLGVIEPGPYVMHIVSRVEGELAPGRHPIDALRACFPAGTLTGAPKVRAAQLIASIEGAQRGAYGGAIGYIGHGGCVDMSITIRSAVIAHGVARVQTGAGIVARSAPRSERLETEHKARGMLEAIAAVNHAAGRVSTNASAGVAC